LKTFGIQKKKCANFFCRENAIKPIALMHTQLTSSIARSIRDNLKLKTAEMIVKK
jgi:hypothetical protein